MVYLAAYLLHYRRHGVVVCYGLLAYAVYSVSHLAVLYECGHASLNAFCALCYFAYDVSVAFGQRCRLVVSEYRAHASHVVSQLCLVSCGCRYDMIEREVAQHTRLNLNLLDVCLPFHFVARCQFVLVHYVHRLEHLYALRVKVTVEY